MEKYLQYSTEVKQALVNNQPIVALESTIISHGMPYPENVEMAKKCERIIRENGAIPATIALMDGKIKIGLNDKDLEQLGSNKKVEKVSRRDLPYVLASKKMGATTVAATMIAAKLANIAVFATGGIGGVHREGETTMDISADLQELAQTNVAVVCAGAKSILDIGRTLEYLETFGVPVVGYKTEKFPSFYSRVSKFDTDFNLGTVDEIADVMAKKWDLGLNGGLVIANPVPAKSELPYEQIESMTQHALAEAKENGITGKQVTPFLLGKIKELTAGKSLKTNIALVYHNAEVAAKISVSYNKI